MKINILSECTPVCGNRYKTRYALDDPRIKSRWMARFSTAVQAKPVAYTASCAMGKVSLSQR